MNISKYFLNRSNPNTPIPKHYKSFIGILIESLPYLVFKFNLNTFVQVIAICILSHAKAPAKLFRLTGNLYNVVSGSLVTVRI